MTTSDKFKETLYKYLSNINFTELYNQVEIDETYNPSKLADITRYVLYFLEINKRLDSNILSSMAFFQDILENRHESRKYLVKIELLYLISKLEEYFKQEIKSPSSDDKISTNLRNMYM